MATDRYKSHRTASHIGAEDCADLTRLRVTFLTNSCPPTLVVRLDAGHEQLMGPELLDAALRSVAGMPVVLVCPRSDGDVLSYGSREATLRIVGLDLGAQEWASVLLIAAPSVGSSSGEPRRASVGRKVPP